MTDSLNAGMPTDRFQVDWYLNSPRVRAALSPEPPNTEWPLDSLQRARTDSQGGGLLRAPHGPPPQPDGRPYALPLPDNVDALRRAGGTLLFDWRFFVRQGAESCLAAGYALVGCILLEEEWHYIFEHRA